MKVKTSSKKWEAFWGLLIFSLFVAYASAHADESTLGTIENPDCTAASTVKDGGSDSSGGGGSDKGTDDSGDAKL